MITRDELLAQAKAFDLNDADVQRDYLFGWLIAGLFNVSTLADSMVLKGGNALRKAHLPGTRFSDDLDVSVAHAVNPELVLEQLNEVCRFANAGSGIGFNLDRNRMSGEQQIDPTRHVYKYKLYFTDAIGGRDHVQIALRVDVTEYDRLYLPSQQRPLIHPYADADALECTVTTVALEEALADKLKCLLQRRYCYDLFDVAYGAFGDHGVDINRSAVLDVFLHKTVFGRSPAAARSLLMDLPLNAFRGFWGKVLTPALSRLSFDGAVDLATSGIQELFSGFGDAFGQAYAFYPSHLRNLILEAGAGRQLLEVTYHGVTRWVEPYSLKFKTRKSDGVGQEYLYVWDQTGGRSSGPGMKSFLHTDIQSMSVLSETFAPRFEIALAKAGDLGQTGIFTGSGRPRTFTTRRRRVLGPQYRVCCSTCGKVEADPAERLRAGLRAGPVVHPLYDVRHHPQAQEHLRVSLPRQVRPPRVTPGRRAGR